MQRISFQPEHRVKPETQNHDNSAHLSLPVLTVPGVARELRCSKAQVHNLINAKLLGLPPVPVLRIGRRVVVRHEALQRWMEWIERRECEIQRGSRVVFWSRDEDMEYIAGA